MQKTKKLSTTIYTITVCALLITGCSSQTNNSSIPTLDTKEKKESVEKTIETVATLEVPEEKTEPVSITAKYKIEFIAEWSKETHPDYYPSGAHFSPFVAYSHNNTIQSKIFIKNNTPTKGIEEMSESGDTSILIEEIQEIIDENFAQMQTKGKRIDSPGKDSSQLDLSQEHSYITFVSMLAPSPDWFVANSTNLFKDGKWIETIEIELITYDSGGDDGEELTSADKDSNPKQPITTFDKKLQNLGKIVITKIDE